MAATDASRLVRTLATTVAVLAGLAATVGLVAILTRSYPELGRYQAGFGAGTTEDTLADHAYWVGRAGSALLFTATGWYLTTKRPSVILGPIALAAGAANATAVLASQWVLYSQLGGRHLIGGSAAILITGWSMAVEPVALAAIFVFFPDGRWPEGRVRYAAILGLTLACGGLLHAPFTPITSDPDGPLAALRNPIHIAVLPGLPDLALIYPGLLLALAVLVIRWLKAQGSERRVLRSLAVVALIATIPMPPSGFSQLVTAASTTVVLVTVIAGVLRNRVYGIDLVLNRTLVYATLSLAIAGVYGLLVAGASMFGGSAGTTSGLVATIVAAFMLFPLRQRVQRLVNRFLYGQRDEPYDVLSTVGARLEAAGTAATLVPDVAESIAAALKVPYVAIEIDSADGSTALTEYGRPSEEVERFPLTSQGRMLGALLVGQRAGETALAPDERRLLENVARQTAVAAANVILTDELVRSRERVVNAAEEERRRLRRDLHDGIGPVLTAAASRVDAARNLLRRDPERAEEHLRDVRADLTSALDDLRRLVYALRPPALDQLGLLGALRELARRNSVPVALDVRSPLGNLSAATEIAVYRIVSEALANVTRHSSATRCDISILCNDALHLEVSDDGRSVDLWSPGVGLSSMRERATDLGGTWIAGPSPQGGWRVLVDLPLAASIGAAP